MTILKRTTKSVFKSHTTQLSCYHNIKCFIERIFINMKLAFLFVSSLFQEEWNASHRDRYQQITNHHKDNTIIISKLRLLIVDCNT